MKGKLTKKNMRDIERAEKSVKGGDLYDALHRVGDDPVKSEIERALKQALDEATFRKVVAVFKVAVTP